MRAALRSLHSADTDDGSLGSFRPDDSEHFALHVMALVGPADGPGEESFDFTVCSPSWVARQELAKGFAFMRHTLLLARWDAGLVERAISDLCARPEGADWAEVGQKL